MSRDLDDAFEESPGFDVSQSCEMSPKQLFELVFDQLCAMASAHMKSQRSDHTLQTAGLVGEAYLRLSNSDAHFADRTHYLRVASRAMRQILVDHARRREAGKRPPNSRRVALDDFIEEIEIEADSVTELDGALVRLEESEPELARFVELHVFGGQTIKACAEAMDMTERTAFRRWEAARAFLEKSIREDRDA